MYKYYEILNVKQDATLNEVKVSYRKLAKLYHPDTTKLSKEIATEKFKELVEAYEVLSDKDKRKIYDELGDEKFKISNEQSNPNMGIDPAEIMKKMFGMGNPNESDVPDVFEKVKVTLEQLYTGAIITCNLERATLCTDCNGTGAHKGAYVKCKTCKGQGRLMMQFAPGMMTQATCHHCKGSGMDASVEKCSKCTGKQFYKENVKIKVNVPIGVHHKYQIIVEEQGNEIPKDEQADLGRTRSNVIFVVNEATHNVFKRGVVVPGKKSIDYADLLMDIDITFVESIVGFIKQFNHLDGKKIIIQNLEPSRHGDIFVAKGKGMPKENNKSVFGDLFVRLNVEHPASLKLGINKRNKLYNVITTKNLKDKDFELSTNAINLITLDKYKSDSGNSDASNPSDENDDDKFRKKYKNRRNNMNNNSDDSDDESDNDGSFGNPFAGGQFGGGQFSGGQFGGGGQGQPECRTM
jgi:DnaJ-related protein SCJ1